VDESLDSLSIAPLTIALRGSRHFVPARHPRQRL